MVVTKKNTVLSEKNEEREMRLAKVEKNAEKNVVVSERNEEMKTRLANVEKKQAKTEKKIASLTKKNEEIETRLANVQKKQAKTEKKVAKTDKKGASTRRELMLVKEDVLRLGGYLNTIQQKLALLRMGVNSIQGHELDSNSFRPTMASCPTGSTLRSPRPTKSRRAPPWAPTMTSEAPLRYCHQHKQTYHTQFSPTIQDSGCIALNQY